jgi:hypothetical protein
MQVDDKYAGKLDEKTNAAYWMTYHRDSNPREIYALLASIDISNFSPKEIPDSAMVSAPAGPGATTTGTAAAAGANSSSAGGDATGSASDIDTGTLRALVLSFLKDSVKAVEDSRSRSVQSTNADGSCSSGNDAGRGSFDFAGTGEDIDSAFLFLPREQRELEVLESEDGIEFDVASDPSWWTGPQIFDKFQAWVKRTHDRDQSQSLTALVPTMLKRFLDLVKDLLRLTPDKYKRLGSSSSLRVPEQTSTSRRRAAPPSNRPYAYGLPSVEEAKRILGAYAGNDSRSEASCARDQQDSSSIAAAAAPTASITAGTDSLNASTASAAAPASGPGLTLGATTVASCACTGKCPVCCNIVAQRPASGSSSASGSSDSESSARPRRRPPLPFKGGSSSRSAEASAAGADVVPVAPVHVAGHGLSLQDDEAMLDMSEEARIQMACSKNLDDCRDHAAQIAEQEHKLTARGFVVTDYGGGGDCFPLSFLGSLMRQCPEYFIATFNLNFDVRQLQDLDLDTAKILVKRLLPVVRSQTADFILENMSKFEQFLPGTTPFLSVGSDGTPRVDVRDQLQTYAQNLKESSMHMWFDELAIVATSALYNVDVKIWSTKGSSYDRLVKDDDNLRESLEISDGFLNVGHLAEGGPQRDGMHFVSVQPRSPPAPPVPAGQAPAAAAAAREHDDHVSDQQHVQQQQQQHQQHQHVQQQHVQQQLQPPSELSSNLAVLVGYDVVASSPSFELEAAAADHGHSTAMQLTSNQPHLQQPETTIEVLVLNNARPSDNSSAGYSDGLPNVIDLCSSADDSDLDSDGPAQPDSAWNSPNKAPRKKAKTAVQLALQIKSEPEQSEFQPGLLYNTTPTPGRPGPGPSDVMSPDPDQVTPVPTGVLSGCIRRLQLGPVPADRGHAKPTSSTGSSGSRARARSRFKLRKKNPAQSADATRTSPAAAAGPRSDRDCEGDTGVRIRLDFNSQASNSNLRSGGEVDPVYVGTSEAEGVHYEGSNSQMLHHLELRKVTWYVHYELN